MKRAVLSSLREWWPELLCAALLTAVAFAGQPDDILFAVFCAIIGGVFWAMGYRHRSLSLHRKVDRMAGDVGELVTEVRAGRDEPRAERGRPRLSLVRRDS